MRARVAANPAETHLNDQATAAAAETSAMHQRVADTLGWERAVRLNRESIRPPKVAQLVGEIEDRAYRDGGMMPCRHLRKGRPEPVFVFAHEPTMIFCARCKLEGDLIVRGTREDRTCDFCRQYFVGGVRPFGVQSGYMTISGGICSPCRGDEMPVAAKAIRKQQKKEEYRRQRKARRQNG